MKQIELISKYNITTDSYIKAVQELNAESLTDVEYLDRIEELVGGTVDLKGASPKYTYMYFVENVIKNGENYWLNDSIERARKFVDKYDWAMKKETPQQNEETIVKTGKKGAKKIQAIKLYNERKNEEMSRKQWIELLISEIGLTKAGASTYFHNLKTGQYK